jgi:hypothetical protein
MRRIAGDVVVRALWRSKPVVRGNFVEIQPP